MSNILKSQSDEFVTVSSEYSTTQRGCIALRTSAETRKSGVGKHVLMEAIRRLQLYCLSALLLNR